LIYNQKITLKDIKANIHIGVTEEERQKRQEILITLELIPIIDSPPKNDSIEETVNYSKIREEVLEISNSRSFNLLETLCWVIADNIKNNFKVEQVTVIAKKFPYKDVDYVSYSITI